MVSDKPTDARPGSLFHRELEDGYEVVVYPMTYGKARLCLSETGEWGSILDGYCYADPARAIEAAKAWTGRGDPLAGWHRHLGSGRRREGGDPSKEHVNW